MCRSQPPEVPASNDASSQVKAQLVRHSWLALDGRPRHSTKTKRTAFMPHDGIGACVCWLIVVDGATGRGLIDRLSTFAGFRSALADRFKSFSSDAPVNGRAPHSRTAPRTSQAGNASSRFTQGLYE